MQLFLIYIFYLLLILILSGVMYRFSSIENKMFYGLVGAMIGIVISAILWYYYGRYMVTTQS